MEEFKTLLFKFGTFWFQGPPDYQHEEGNIFKCNDSQKIFVELSRHRNILYELYTDYDDFYGSYTEVYFLPKENWPENIREYIILIMCDGLKQGNKYKILNINNISVVTDNRITWGKIPSLYPCKNHISTDAFVPKNIRQQKITEGVRIENIEGCGMILVF